MRGLIILLCGLSLLGQNALLAQGSGPTKGKEFWVGFMQNFEIQEGAEELSFFVTSSQNTTGTIEVPNLGYSEPFNVTANQTTTVSIDNALVEHFTSEVIEDKGIFISTQDTVSVFAINFNNFTADATKILPIQSLGIEYMVSSYPSGFQDWGSELLIVATEDDTEIEITPSTLTQGGNAAGVPFVVQLDEGQSYQIKVGEMGGDLTGTHIQGTESSGDCRPFAVFSGTSCVNIPQECSACDHVFEQNFPVETWGTEFHVIPFNLSESCTYRVLAREDNTEVFADGAPLVTLNAGEVVEYNFQEVPVCITANNGICVTQFMEGVTCTGYGDPAMMILNDATQKIDQITFSTVNVNVINEHGLTVITATADINSVLFDGAPLDADIFEQMPGCPGHSFARFSIAEGSHTLSAANGVIGYVYGTGEAESYAYSVGSFTPPPPLVVDDVLCTDGEVNLASEEGLIDVIWYTLSNPEDTVGVGPLLTLTPPIVSDVYVAVGNQFQSGCEQEELFSVETPTPPALEVFQSETEICQYEEVQFEVEPTPSGTYLYSWSPVVGLDNPTIASPVATPLETTTYTVEVSTLSGCSFATAEVTVEVTGGGIANFEATSDIPGYCSQGEVEFGLTYEEPVFQDDFDPGVSWGLWQEVLNGEQDDACGLVSGDGLWFNGDGERSATTNAVDVSGGGSVLFTLAIGSGAFPCEDAEPGDDVALEYSTSGPGGPWTVIQVFPADNYPEPTSVSVTIPDAAESAATLFKWRQLNNGGDGEDNWIIDNVFIGATSDGGYSVEWLPSEGLNDNESFNPVASPEATTNYIVTMTDDQSGCIYTDSVLVIVEEGFELQLTQDASVCEIEGFELQAVPVEPGEYIWEWSNPELLDDENTGTPTVNENTPNTFTVSVTSAQGCTISGEISLDLIFESFDLGQDEVFCQGESFEIVTGFDATFGFDWTTGDTSSSLEVTETGTYGVVITSPEGCTVEDEIEVIFQPTPQIEIDTNIDVCEGDEYVLDAGNPGSSFDWSTGEETQVITVTETDTYSVEVTAPNGCSAVADLEVAFLQNPEVPFELEEIGDCEGEVLQLDAGNAGSTYEWSTAETTQQINVAESGTYTVAITNELGCTIENAIDVVFEPYPNPDLGPDSLYCAGTVVTLDSDAFGEEYLWSTGETTATIDVTATGIYSVEVSTAYCSASDEVDLFFAPLPVDVLPNDTLVCFDEPPYELIVDAGNSGATYAWNNGETGQSIVVAEEGYFTVAITTPLGCTSLFDFLVTDDCFGDYLYVPNAFTPNNDGINDVFMPIGDNIAEIEVQVWNRWGDLIWSTNKLGVAWDGSYQNGDYYVENEQYVYVVRYRYFTNETGDMSETIEKKGSVVLIR